MARSLNIWIATALALTIFAPEAQALVRHPRHRVVQVSIPAISSSTPGGPIWTAGPAVRVGTGNRYVADSGPDSFADFGMPFAANRGFDLLPSRFNPPGRPEPLFQF